MIKRKVKNGQLNMSAISWIWYFHQPFVTFNRIVVHIHKQITLLIRFKGWKHPNNDNRNSYDSPFEGYWKGYTLYTITITQCRNVHCTYFISASAGANHLWNSIERNERFIPNCSAKSGALIWGFQTVGRSWYGFGKEHEVFRDIAFGC